MRPRAKLILGAAAAALVSTAASAADPIMAPGAPPPPMAAPGFDWSGPYVGAIAGLHNEAGFSYQYGGVQFGYNLVFRDKILAGLEVETIHWMFPFPFVSAALNGRLGFIAGDRVLLYGEVGIGTYFFGGAGVVTAGGGVEVAVTNAISVFGEVNREFFIAGGGLVPLGYSNFELGINYHPGGSAMMASSGGFNGVYFGAFGGYFVGPAFAEAGVQFGFNHTLGNRFVAGTEIETYYSPGTGAFVSASLNGRLGATFGNFLAYGEAGIGTWIGVPLWSAGGGIEFALGNRGISLFTEATAQFLFGGGGYFGTRVDAGMNFAVGN